MQRDEAVSGTHSPKTERSKSGTSRKIMFEIVAILALVTILVARKREWILSRFSRFSNPEVK